MASKRYRLGDLQFRIMKVLWEREQATIGEVHEALFPSLGLAYTTIATMLRKMERRGLVAHENRERRLIYHPCVDVSSIRQGALNDLVDRFFHGSLPDVVSHLLSTRPLSEEELQRLEKVISEHRRKQ